MTNQNEQLPWGVDNITDIDDKNASVSNTRMSNPTRMSLYWVLIFMFPLINLSAGILAVIFQWPTLLSGSLDSEFERFLDYVIPFPMASGFYALFVMPIIYPWPVLLSLIKPVFNNPPLFFLSTLAIHLAILGYCWLNQDSNFTVNKNISWGFVVIGTAVAMLSEIIWCIRTMLKTK